MIPTVSTPSTRRPSKAPLLTLRGLRYTIRRVVPILVSELMLSPLSALPLEVELCKVAIPTTKLAVEPHRSLTCGFGRSLLTLPHKGLSLALRLWHWVPGRWHVRHGVKLVPEVVRLAHPHLLPWGCPVWLLKHSTLRALLGWLRCSGGRRVCTCALSTGLTNQTIDVLEVGLGVLVPNPKAIPALERGHHHP